jgi:hypothetical protein
MPFLIGPRSFVYEQEILAGAHDVDVSPCGEMRKTRNAGRSPSRRLLVTRGPWFSSLNPGKLPE